MTSTYNPTLADAGSGDRFDLLLRRLASLRAFLHTAVPNTPEYQVAGQLEQEAAAIEKTLWLGAAVSLQLLAWRLRELADVIGGIGVDDDLCGQMVLVAKDLLGLTSRASG